MNKKAKRIPARNNKNRDFKQLFDLRYKHQLSLRQIEDISGVSKSTLHVWFKPIEDLIKSP